MFWTEFHSAPSSTAKRDRPTDSNLVVGMADLNLVEDKASQESKVPFSENIRSKEDAKKNIHVSDFVKSEHRDGDEGFIVLFRIPAILSYRMDIAFISL